MELSQLANDFVGIGHPFGKTKSGKFWVRWSEQDKYLCECRRCSEWGLAVTKSYLCAKCRADTYPTRTEYHRQQRQKLLAGAVYTCVVCDKAFPAKRSTRQTCSDKCRKKISRNPEKYQGKSAVPTWTEEDAKYMKALESTYFNYTKQIVQSEMRGGMSKEKADELWDYAWETWGGKADALRKKKAYLDSLGLSQ